jgi:acyl-CoA dehydrogenase
MKETPTRSASEIGDAVRRFMAEHIFPNEALWRAQIEENARAGRRWQPPAILDELKERARAQGLWNLWWPKAHGGLLSNGEYAPISEQMGHVVWAAEVFNCSAPDTGNMETLLLYGSDAQKKRWLDPLAAGSIRSAFAMTEPDSPSSDATRIACAIRRDGEHYVISGRKWWASGAMDSRCAIFIVMGKTDPEAEVYRQQAMILVPADTPGVRIVRPLSVFGYDEAPHGFAEVVFDNVRVPADNILLGEGRGFEMAQGRLGPGRVHHCMRLIGAAERGLALLCQRSLARTPFGRPLAEQTVTQERIAEARIAIETARLLTLKAARMMDEVGNKVARAEIAMIKVYVPNIACRVLDWAIQAHGGGGLSGDWPIAELYAHARSLRLADGPDEVHRNHIARMELAKHRPRTK